MPMLIPAAITNDRMPVHLESMKGETIARHDRRIKKTKGAIVGKRRLRAAPIPTAQ